MVFALAGACAFVVGGRAQGAQSIGLYVAGACAIQLRLVANLLDGLMAVEGGKKSAVGDLYNDVPDRVSDTLLLVSLGYAAPGVAWAPAAGWAAALAAALTAYVRFVGGTLLGTQDFRGPFAKQHRMFACTLAAVGAAVERGLDQPSRVVPAALALVAGGALVTAWRRLSGVAAGLRARGPKDAA